MIFLYRLSAWFQKCFVSDVSSVVTAQLNNQTAVAVSSVTQRHTQLVLVS